MTLDRYNDEELKNAYEFLSDNILSNSDIESISAMLEYLKNKMADEVCHFSFKKSDGTLREAYGTRNSEMIDRYCPTASRPKNRRANDNPSTFTYFDLEKDNWRCFNIANLRKVDMEYGV